MPPRDHSGSSAELTVRNGIAVLDRPLVASGTLKLALRFELADAAALSDISERRWFPFWELRDPQGRRAAHVDGGASSSPGEVSIVQRFEVPDAAQVAGRWHLRITDRDAEWTIHQTFDVLEHGQASWD